ncbi:auxin efflux carrier [Liquorilactobacillus mali KCTC 3596 = DSM 20444]|uniref:Auxin efflux carrier n=2 Tax=Liquorilactobacillus mali TaxID=1618 RepID=A0A0R2E6M1_9LACO|nr:auxin efflux carrier [Liquorilactobacillus mali KCTC 3596 = DSM 20444]
MEPLIMNISVLNNQIILIFLLMLVGVLINKIGFMHPQTANDLTNILLNIVSPCLIINAFEQSYSADRVQQLLLAGLGIIAFYLIEILLASIFFKKVKDSNLQRIYKYGSIFSNAGFMGIPLVSSLFGKMGVFFAVVSLAGFNIFNWTYGLSLFNKDKSNIKKLSRLKTVLLNPNIISIFLGLILFIFSVSLPSTISQTVKYVGSINTPLSMIVIGNSLGNIKIQKEAKSLGIWLTVFLRNILFPILAIVVLEFLGVSGVALDTTVIMMACPVAGIVVLFTLQNKDDVSPAITLMGISTILSLITIPIVFYLIPYI